LAGPPFINGMQTATVAIMPEPSGHAGNFVMLFETVLNPARGINMSATQLLMAVVGIVLAITAIGVNLARLIEARNMYRKKK
jgi:hypothetical protein